MKQTKTENSSHNHYATHNNNCRDKNGKFFIVPIFDTPTLNNNGGGVGDVEDCYGTTPANAGYYNLIVQFFPDSHFVVAPLDAYQQNPAEAQPVLSFSVFEDYIDSRNMCLVRADVIAKNLKEEDARKVISMCIKNWEGGGGNDFVDKFNNSPAEFDFDQYLKSAREEWFGMK